MTTIETLTLTTTSLTAIVGLVVAYQAYRGYRRNASEQMRALAVGIVFIAVVPYVVVHSVGLLVEFTDAQALLTILLSHTVGLLAVYRSLTK